ncbi:hypothetical protein Svir_02710 [Saccharomonospora viridis DSM 43017]|uniref:Uncharacterized protein n=1 Tax=Saccharomonospora viridis (strain ATCC 15386 / DSM 43017 / JCM 3036 / CCUG 5913 / NBRC 12207 / NCIMB 9602 / P101) TaxID=471857 RepID=C7MSZ2_SACVD|nr:hypothetical protein Svir_02710 [Saccharomonospora viridis DSM 43017]
MAELLAEHGGQLGGTPRRRRRRAAEDGDASGGRQPGIADTAPQAIIERVRAEGASSGSTSRSGGRPNGRAQAGDEARRGRPGQPRTGPQKLPPRPPQGSGSYPVPGGEDVGRPPLPPRGRGARPTGASGSLPVTPPAPQSSLPPSNTHSTGYGKPVANGFRPPQNTGSHPAPPPGGGAVSGVVQQSAGSGAQQPPQPNQGPPRDVAERMNATRRVPAPVPPPPQAGTQEGTLAARLDGLDDVDESGVQQPAQPGGPASQQGGRAQRSGAFPMPHRRRPPRTAPAVPPEPSTEQFPAVAESDAEKTALAEPVRDEEKTTLSEAVRPDEPPAGLSNWPGARGDGQSVDSSNEATQVGVAAVLNSDDDDDDDHGPATGHYVPNFDDDDEDDDFDGLRHRTGVLGDDPLGEDDDFDDHGTRYADYDDESYPDMYAGNPYADDDDDEPDSDSDDAGSAEEEEPKKRRFRKARRAEPVAADSEDADEDDGDADDSELGDSPAKQWLVLAGQLALGVAGGAGVWLGFNWLWGRLPAAALIAALVVTVGLVWVVRKVRRAEDTQTTVLALLVGLVVTVSPAALLLVSR